MTIQQKRKILTRISVIQTDIDTLKRVLIDLASQEYVSATLASSGGSKSYTRRGIGDIKETIDYLSKELHQLRRLLKNESGLMPDSIVTIYS